MAMNIERVEEGVANNDNESKLSGLEKENPKKSLFSKWGLLLINIACTVVGTIGGPLLLRLYFLHGGSRKWLTSWLQTAGFPILLLPLSVLYIRSRKTGCKFLIASPLLLVCAAAIGILLGLNNFMYSYGLSFLPVSTSSLFISTQLIFTAFFAFIMVKQKFTPYTINSVVLMTLGSILLGLRKNGDRPEGVTTAQYLLGFVLTIGAAGLGGFALPCIEVAYAKSNKAITYSIVLQFQLCMTIFATLFCTIGMFVNKDFSAMPREANAYELGATKYYSVLVSSAIVWQLNFVGMLGIIFCTSSLFAGIITATLLPITEIAAVVAFSEKFTGEKGMALALGIWGFTSYFYGSYRENKKLQKTGNETAAN